MQELRAKYAASLEDRLQLQLQLRFQQAKALALSSDVRVLQTEVTALRRICETSQISLSTDGNQKLVLVQKPQQQETVDNHSLLTPYTPILCQLFPGQKFTPKDLLSIDNSVREFLVTKFSNDNVQVNLCRVPHTKHGATVIPEYVALSTTYFMRHAIPAALVGDFKDWIIDKIDDILDGDYGGDNTVTVTAATTIANKNDVFSGVSNLSPIEDVVSATGSDSHNDVGIAVSLSASSPASILTTAYTVSPKSDPPTLKRKRGRISASGSQTNGGLPTPPSGKLYASLPAKIIYIIDTTKPSTLHFPTPCPPLLPSGVSNAYSFRAWTDIIRSRHKTFQRATPPMSKHARVFLQSRNISLHCLVPGSAMRISKATFAVPAYLHDEFLEHMQSAFLQVEDGVFGDSTLHSVRPRVIPGGGEGWDPKFLSTAVTEIAELGNDGDGGCIATVDSVDTVTCILARLAGVDIGAAVSNNLLVPTMNSNLCEREGGEDRLAAEGLLPHELKQLKTSHVDEEEKMIEFTAV
ncbi:hypothetical protein HK100_001621 [Physocladia obscura]|uniref:Uncharacterized protein n=1 Tax=Physocladia obscura TaxID=109957 RepID=A0AAD5SY33_9FUNG|nr:hypothetical protein HK100_001621 [Physocladia obscura]